MRIHKEMIVAFIDILGTKQRSIEDAENIYEMFQAFIKRNEERQNNFPKSYSRKCWFFSDCAYLVYYQNGKTEEVSNLEVLRPMLINLSIELLKIWDEGFLVRGGIAMGEGCFHTDKPIFCGDAFNQASAFDREGMPPCIYLSPELANDFARLYKEGKKESRSELGLMLINTPDFPEYILRDDNRYFLNALWYLENSRISVGVDDRTIHPAEFVKKFGLYCESQIFAAHAFEKESVAKKWEWMQEYLYSRLCPFDHDNYELCNLWYSCDNGDARTRLIELYDQYIIQRPDLSSFMKED